MSTERVIVHRSVAAKFTANLHAHFEKIRAGDEKSGSKISSLSSLAFAEGFEAYLKEAEKDGVKFLMGDLKRDGAVIQPHIVTDLKPHMRIWQRESFGPGSLLLFFPGRSSHSDETRYSNKHRGSRYRR